MQEKMMSYSSVFKLFCLVIVVGLLWIAPASAERRVALVIGNNDYNYESLPDLNNAGKDAEGMALALERLGFDVILLRDATERDMGRALREFENRLRKSEVGLVYYAGHGIQSQGVNWLIPSDAEIDIEADLETQGIDASLLLGAMERAGSSLNILILDACRNNPLPQRTRSADKGLASQALPRGIKGTAIIYSAGENEVAQDGPPGGHSVFTGHLLEIIEQPGLKLEDVFKQTASSVSDMTGGQQDPWYYSNIKGDFYFVPEGSTVTIQPPEAASGVDKEALFWESIKDSRNKAEFEAYLEQYPQGTFAALARSRIASLSGESADDEQSNLRSRPFNQETLFWDTIKTSKDKADFEAYLEQYPEGIFATLAKLRIKSLSEKGRDTPTIADEEQMYWNTVTSIASSQAYESYLKKYPNGTHAQEARQKIAALTQPATEDPKTDAADKQPVEQPDPPDEKLAWENTLKLDTRQAYQDYLDQFPDGAFVSLARLKMAALPADTDKTQPQAADDQEKKEWETALDVGTRNAFEAYLNRYPDGTFSALARLKMAALPATKVATKETKPKPRTDRNEEDLFWVTMQAINTREAYQSYLDKYPDGSHAPQARTKLAALAPMATMSPQREAKTMVRVRQSGAVNVRSGPGTNYDIVDRLAANSEVEMLGVSENGSWYEVVVPSGDTGFIYKTLATIIPPVTRQEDRSGDDRPLNTGQTFRDCPDCPEMVVLPSGTFMMGSLEDSHAWYLKHGGKQEWAESETPRHEVNINYRLAVGRFEVTQDEFATFIRMSGYRIEESCKTFDGDWVEEEGISWRNPGISQTGDHPVVCVDFEAAQAYAQWLSEVTGKEYRLPTEAEWEYLARAGTETSRYWGDDLDNKHGCNYANVADEGAGWNPNFGCNDGYKFTAPVGNYRPNDFGVYDVIGNVWEWTDECWHSNYQGAPVDGSRWEGGNCEYRMVRGGAWDKVPGVLRASQRNGDKLDQRYNNLGFRVVRTLGR